MSETAAVTVLVVDDNDAERYYVARVIREAGYRVLEAGSGGEALRLVGQRPDLVTLDVRLPDLSGFEVCRRIKADPSTRDIPVLHISASFTTPDAKAEGLEGGADAYLTHPVEPTELLATVRALLRARRAEQQVRSAAREWTVTFDLIGDPICLTGPRGEVIRCNAAFAELAGQPFAALIGRPLAELLPAMVDVEPAPGEAREIRIGPRCFRVTVGAGPLAHAWVFADVTERERQAEALRRSQVQVQQQLQEIEAVYNSAPVGLAVLDRESRYLRVNQQLAAMNGQPIEAHLGRTVAEVLPQFGQFYAPVVREVFTTGQPIVNLEVRGESPAQPGVERIWLQTWYPQRGPDGEVTAVHVAVDDVTERRRLQEQLLEARRLEAIGRLAGGVAHETNNQMTVVLGCANFALREPGVPEAIRQDIEQIRTAAERTARITAQLLAFGRRQHLRPEVVELDAIIARLQPILERALGGASTLRLQRGAPGHRVRADIGQLEQVLLNLTLNARDAMPEGGTLEIRTEPVAVAAAGPPADGEPAPGRYVYLTVTDTGLGMAPETLQRAFEPFFTTKPPGKGTGLGLSMVYGVVKQSGGAIRAASTPGRGTRFEIYLPAAAEREDGPEGEPGQVHSAAGEHALVVEDDPVVRRIMVRELTQAGYQVVEAGDGSAALEAVRRAAHRFRVVISDFVMPGMGGGELADALERLQPGTPVLLVSGHPDHETMQQLMETGRPYLQKPFGADELLSRVRQLLEGR